MDFSYKMWMDVYECSSKNVSLTPLLRDRIMVTHDFLCGMSVPSSNFILILFIVCFGMCFDDCTDFGVACLLVCALICFRFGAVTVTEFASTVIATDASRFTTVFYWFFTDIHCCMTDTVYRVYPI